MRVSLKGITACYIFAFLVVNILLVSVGNSWGANSDIAITGYQLVSKTRVSRTEYEYAYKMTVVNNGSEEATNIVGRVTSLASTTTVTDDSLTLGIIAPGATATSSDTFKVKINLSYAFNASNLSWSFLYDPNPGIPGLMEGAVYPPAPTEDAIIQYPTEDGLTEMKIVKGRVIIQFKRTISEADAESLLSSYNAIIIGKVPKMRFYTVEVSSGNELVVSESLRQNTYVEFAEPDFIWEALYTPAPIEGITNFPHLEIIKAPEAWNYINTKWGVTFDKNPIQIGIIDVNFFSFNDDNDFKDGNKYRISMVTQSKNTDTQAGHGNHVASILAATGNNTVGSNIGIDWENTIRAGAYPYFPNFYDLIDKGVDIINFSMGGKSDHCKKEELIFLKELIKVVNSAKEDYPDSEFLVVKASGNDGCDLGNIEKPSNLLIVGGSDYGYLWRDSGSFWDALSFDHGSNYGGLIDIAAPYRTKLFDNYIASGLTDKTGTSFSSPMVAGAASLIWSHDSTLKTAADVANRLKSTAYKGTDGKGIVEFGGAGILDIYAALTTKTGASWTSQSSGSTNTLLGITWDGYKFIAVGMAGTILSSYDGVNWVAENSSTNYNYYAVAYGNGAYVAVGAASAGGSSVIISSNNGINWSENYLSSFSSGLTGVAYGNGIFVTVGNWGAIYKSTDGVNWTKIFTGNSNHLNGISFVNNKFVAVGHDGVIAYSDNGSDWTVNYAGINHQLHGITYGKNMYIASGQTYNGDAGAMLSSVDLVNWTNINSTATSIIKRVTFGDNRFVGVGGNGVLISSDGTSWNKSSPEGTKSFGDVLWDGTQFVAVGEGGGILTSP